MKFNLLSRLGNTSKKTKNNRLKSIGCTDSGRSMVEMLGVLAVIGVLSIAGIAGFNMAMNKYKANELLYEAQKRALSISNKLALGQQGTAQNAYTQNYALDEFPSNEMFGVQFGDPVQVAFGEISIPLSHVPQKICEYMKESAGDNTKSIVSVDGDCTTSETEDLILLFKDDLSPGLHVLTCSRDGNCSGCQVCRSGVCVDDNNQCGQNIECHEGVCVCPDGRSTCGNTAQNRRCCSDTQECTTTVCSNIRTLCNSNQNCSQGTYCRMETEENGGGCQPIPTLSAKNWRGQKLYAYKAGNLSWWTCRNICLASGKRMASITNLGLNRANKDLPEEQAMLNKTNNKVKEILALFNAPHFWLDTETWKAGYPYFMYNGYLTGSDQYRHNYSNVLCVD